MTTQIIKGETRNIEYKLVLFVLYYKKKQKCFVSEHVTLHVIKELI